MCKKVSHTWMPLVTSTTRIIMSMICAPPMIVLMRDACPGQSTRVNCKIWPGSCCRCSGMGTVNEEKPRSRVIPLSLLCGCLSRAAVDRAVDMLATAP